MAYNHKKGLFWYNDSNKIAMVSIPKNASTSMRNTYNLTKIDDFLKGEKDYSDFNFITVIRDPMDRVISGYLEILKRANVDAPITRTKKFYNITNPEKRFQQFIYDIQEDEFDGHIENQKHFITNKDGEMIKFYKILSFDNIVNEIKSLNESLNINLNLIRHDNKKSNNDKNIIRSFMSDELIEIVKDIYKDDFILYNNVKNGDI